MRLLLSRSSFSSLFDSNIDDGCKKKKKKKKMRRHEENKGEEKERKRKRRGEGNNKDKDQDYDATAAAPRNMTLAVRGIRSDNMDRRRQTPA